MRPAGPPEVLTVLVFTDYDQGFLETATFCKTNDVKRPGQVGLPDFTTKNMCDLDLSKGADEVTAAVPFAWYTRIMFDELLNPDVEELVPQLDPDTMQETGIFNGTIENTQPVTLTCGGVAVPYGGYYNPAGNAFTYPLGPSLVVQPLDLSTVPTGSECTLAIKDLVVDKDGNKVPTDQQTGYKWKIDTLQFAGSVPAPAAAPGKEAIIASKAPLAVGFNAFVNPASLDKAKISIQEKACAGAACVAADCANTTGATAIPAANIKVGLGADGTSLTLGLTNPVVAGDAWQKLKAYTVSFADGTTVTDAAPASPGTTDLPGAADFEVCFLTK